MYIYRSGKLESNISSHDCSTLVGKNSCWSNSPLYNVYNKDRHVFENQFS